MEKPGLSASYGYNADGIRTQKTENGITTHYVVDSNRDYTQVLAEVTNGTTEVSYTYGDDLVSQTRAGTPSYYLYDGHGSTRALADASGSLTDSYDYDAFGLLLNSSGDTENTYRYSGEQLDSSLDQYYLRARYYDQNSGRFTQMDTWMGHNSDPITLHKYLYGNADPANHTDPTGNFSLGSFSAASTISGILTTASIASSAYDVFLIATGEEEFSARQFATNILLNRLPVKFVAKLLKKYKAETGNTLNIVCMANSFVEGTLVHTKRGLIPIEKVIIGDFVLSFNESSGENEFQEVVHLIQGEKDYEIVSVELTNGDVIEATSKHPFYIDSEWTDADQLTVLDELFALKGSGSVEKISSASRETAVYNLTVNVTHTYYVGEDGFLVHNAYRDCIQKVANMGQFFNTQFGVLYKKISRSNGKAYKGSPIYIVTSKNNGPLRKGDRFYLDTLHKDHIEVFDKGGKFVGAFNLDGTKNIKKTVDAIEKGRELPKNLL